MAMQQQPRVESFLCGARSDNAREGHLNRGGAAGSRGAFKRALPLRTGVVRPSTPITRKTLQDGIYLALRDALMCGEFGPGERLTVTRVANTYGTSIMPVREAMRRLTSEGALESLSTGATRVPVIDSERLQELTELRLNLEGLASRKAATRVTGADCRVLEQLNADVLRAFDAADTLAEAKANEQFHFAIYRLSGSQELVRMIEQLWLKVGPYLAWVLKQGQWPTRPAGRRAFRHHADILAALRRNDEQAAEVALRADLSMAAEVLLRQSRKLANTNP